MIKGKNIFSKEWINSIPKTINNNGCWIPRNRKESSAGYIRTEANGISYSLHRIVVSVYHNINYFDWSLESRHGLNCDRRCFNHNHLKPGTPTDNMLDKTAHGKNENANKLRCPRCSGLYTSQISKSGPQKGKRRRVCLECKRVRRRKK